MKKKPLLVFLSGFMGSGKTSVGRLLAKKLKAPFFDTDDLIVQYSGLSVTDFFKKYGEQKFRAIEKNLIISIKGRAIVSLGGGAILSAVTRQHLRKGHWFYLQASSATILKRLASDTSRPLLNGPDKTKKINDLLKARTPYYQLATHKIITDHKTKDCITKEVLRKLRKQP